MLRDLAIGWVNDAGGPSPETFCRDKEMSHMSRPLRRLINSEKKLRQACQKNARKDPAIVQAAVEVINRLLKVSAPQGSQDGPPLLQQVEHSRQDTNTILNYERLKEVADSLNFNSLSQKSHNGTKDIRIHNMKEPNENLKYLVFDMANRVTKYSNLQPSLRKKVLRYCAKVLYYDHGYIHVWGIGNLDSTWGKQLDEAYENRSNTCPLKNKKEGQRVSC